MEILLDNSIPVEQESGAQERQPDETWPIFSLPISRVQTKWESNRNFKIFTQIQTEKESSHP